MDTFVVEEFFHLIGYSHVIGRRSASHMRTGDDFASGKLPHVEFVNVEDFRYALNKSILLENDKNYDN